jgi:steroid delta-isomerase-like uncharacterized protein
VSGAETVREFYANVGSGDLEQLVAMFEPGATFSAPSGEHTAPDGVRMTLQVFRAAFPGFTIDVQRAIESGDEVAVEGVWRGTNNGPMMTPDGGSMPATGKTVTLPFASIWTFRDGKIAAQREYWDMATSWGSCRADCTAIGVSVLGLGAGSVGLWTMRTSAC